MLENRSVKEIISLIKTKETSIKEVVGFYFSDHPLKHYPKKFFELQNIDYFNNEIIDIKKNGGWVHWSQLKKINSLITTNEKLLFSSSTIK